MALAGYGGLVVAFLAAGYAITELGWLSWIRTADRHVSAWVAGHRTGVLDVVTSGSSNLAATWTVLGVLFGAGSVLSARRLWPSLVLLCVAVAVEFTVFMSVTFVVARPRPEVAIAALPATGSFPSGHAAVSVALYGSIALIVRSMVASPRVRRAAAGFAGAIALVVAGSRVYVGLHFVSDVLAGLALGAASLAIAHRAAAVASNRTVTDEQSRSGGNLCEPGGSDR